MNRLSIISGLLLTISLCCCSLEGLIDTTFGIFNSTEPVSAEQFTREMTNSAALPDEIQNFQGVRYELPGFTNYYLRYEVADRDWALAWVEALPSVPSAEFVSQACQPTLESIVADDFSPNPTVIDLGQVAFWQPEQVAEKEYYNCLRFPWNHSLLFDLSSNTIYHVIQEIRE